MWGASFFHAPDWPIMRRHRALRVLAVTLQVASLLGTAAYMAATLYVEYEAMFATMARTRR